jgi:septum site-determining protein MinC
MVAQPAPALDDQAPFQIRGHLRALLTLRVLAPRDIDFFKHLADTVAGAPNFFHNAPVVLDLEAVRDEAPVNMAEFARRLRQQRLVPVGVQNGGEEWSRAAVNAGLAVLSPARLTSAPVEAAPSPPEPAATAEPAPPPGPQPARIVTEPVRGGQQVYAQNADLIVLAPVSPGAEVLADGSVHVYNRLRGRAFAGVSGDERARIFCHALQAELVFVAGHYLVAEEIDEGMLGKGVQIRLDGERLVIEPLPLAPERGTTT